MSIDTALEQIEAQLQQMGQRVVSAVRGAMRALEERDRELADEVIAFDDEVDNHFLGIEHSIQALLALQTPVARDLRLLLAMIHINLLLERSADGCVTIAKLSRLVSDVEPDPALVETALDSVLFDPDTRRRVLAAAPQLLERYSWQESAQRTLQVLLAAAGH